MDGLELFQIGRCTGLLDRDARVERCENLGTEGSRSKPHAARPTTFIGPGAGLSVAP